MATHIIKKTHIDGVRLDMPITWCGSNIDLLSNFFIDAQHFALSNESGSPWGYPACEKCKEAIVKAIQT